MPIVWIITFVVSFKQMGHVNDTKTCFKVINATFVKKKLLVREMFLQLNTQLVFTKDKASSFTHTEKLNPYLRQLIKILVPPFKRQNKISWKIIYTRLLAIIFKLKSIYGPTKFSSFLYSKWGSSQQNHAVTQNYKTIFNLWYGIYFFCVKSVNEYFYSKKYHATFWCEYVCMYFMYLFR